MTAAFELAGAVLALTLLAAFIVWDTERLRARSNRDWLRALNQPTAEEAKANFLWRIYRDQEYRLAMWLTASRNLDRVNELLIDLNGRAAEGAWLVETTNRHLEAVE